MHRIVVSDIFGRTWALERLCNAIGGAVDVVDPYAGKCMGFQTEEQAYECFIVNVGLKKYCELLQSKLEKIPFPICLIGFSVGASAIWQISESLSNEKVKRAVCFYGSQIRYFTEVKPGVVIEHILPTHESGVSIDELVDRLSGKENVVLYRTPYLHGFMNELSNNYNTLGYTKYVNWLRETAG